MTTGEHLGAPERKQRFSLRTRVTWLAAACVAVALALVSFGAYLTVSRSLYNQLDENLQQRAVEALHSSAVIQGIRLPSAFTVGDVRIGILNSDGTLFYPRNGQRPPAGPSEFAVARGDNDGGIRTDSGTNSRVVSLPIGPGRALVVAQSLDSTQHTLSKLAVVLIVISGAGVVIAALAGTVVAQGGLRPVLRLTRATERIARTGDLHPIPASGDDELARLTKSFNAMLAALAESQASQRQLVADAGHELRTPLTSLRTNIELLLASEGTSAEPGTPTLSQQDRAELRADVLAQLDELTTLIGDLVELARENPEEQATERVELVDVVERALERARRRAGDVQFAVFLQPWTICGDAGALERAVLNLLDNAVKFSSPGGQVQVTLRPLGDGSAVIEVADSGPGIADEDLQRVFDRFYRSSEARTLPGSGLGLAIVKQVVERHGGAVYANHAPGGGALLTLRLPGQPG